MERVAVKYFLILLVLVLAGCSASVATNNPACILMCQNSGDVSTNTAQPK